MSISKLLREISNPSNPSQAFIICLIIGSICGTIIFVTEKILLGIGIAVLFISLLALMDYLSKRHRKQPKKQLNKETTLLIDPLHVMPGEGKPTESPLSEIDFEYFAMLLSDEDFEELKKKHPELADHLEFLPELRLQKIAFIARLTAKQMKERLEEGIDHICSWRDLEQVVASINWELKSATSCYFPPKYPDRKTGS